MILNDACKMVEKQWLKLPERFKNIKLYEYTVMPNHFHAILEIVLKTVGATLVVARNDNIASNNNNPKFVQPHINRATTMDCPDGN